MNYICSTTICKHIYEHARRLCDDVEAVVSNEKKWNNYNTKEAIKELDHLRREYRLLGGYKQKKFPTPINI